MKTEDELDANLIREFGVGAAEVAAAAELAEEMRIIGVLKQKRNERKARDGEDKVDDLEV